MSREQLFVMVLLVAIFNGIFSPWVFIAVSFAPAWLPGFIPMSPGALFYGASLLVSSLTLLLSGVPAALAERVLGDEIGPVGALWIWLSAAVVMAIPAIEAVIAQL